MEWTQSPPQSTTGTLELSTLKLSGTEQMPSLQRNPTTPTQSKETMLTTKTQKLTHTLWMSTPSILKNLPKKKGKNASRKPRHYSRNCTTFQSNNSNLHPYTKTSPRKSQEPRRVAKIEEVLEVQQGEEVSDEEELVAKLYMQDF